MTQVTKRYKHKSVRGGGAPNLPDGNIRGQPSKSDEEKRTREEGGARYLTREQEAVPEKCFLREGVTLLEGRPLGLPLGQANSLMNVPSQRYLLNSSRRGDSFGTASRAFLWV